MPTNAPVEPPVQPFDADDNRRLMANGGLKDAKPQWDLGQPPPKTERAVRLHVMSTLRMFALATAYRRQGEREATGGEPVAWQRGRRQLLEPHRDQVIVCAQGNDGIFHGAEDSLLLGAKLTDVPPGIGTLPEVLAKYGRTAHG